MYEKSRCQFEVSEFKNPSNQYRGAPFWAWNRELDREELLRQIGYFRQMGMGGFHIHSRTGLTAEYLGEEFFGYVLACAAEAKSKGMFTFLYDEDRWPSGFGGGLVTKNPEFVSRYLVFSPMKKEDWDSCRRNYTSTMRTLAKGDGILLERYEIQLEKGFLKSYMRLEEGQKEGENTWYLYEETAEKSPWYNNEAYADTLNPLAVKEFLKVTHEKYKQYLGESFGTDIPSIFTDEPQFPHKTALRFPEEKGEVILPYTDRFPEFYGEMYGENFFEKLPESYLRRKTEKECARGTDTIMRLLNCFQTPTLTRSGSGAVIIISC